MAKKPEFFKRMLEEEREKLVKELETFRTRKVSGAVSHSNHMAEVATDAFDQACGQSLERHLERLLHEVEYALSKFEKGIYGICENCGKPIEETRLETLPQALYCLECQYRHELNPRRA
ncbi:MAG: TraR/DksA C4-type zinc finger protein [Anaerolineae bacterium]|nr:TraR/DksA C4-type zinc finger protein [Anaerolineae bacterium]MDW8101608.1 TraR/DksA C4-type zinc finger protein [Anaerolineae bacterium]